ncbi:MAG: CpsD/CapB family tyrosine-protein kinase [Ruthenibacterium sp.]
MRTKKSKRKVTEERKLQLISNNASFPFVEAYKALRTNLNFMAVANHYKKIIITSAIPQEGKSNVAINLAVSIAETHKRVLLMDTDLRKPILHKYLRIGRKAAGLTSVLSGTAKFADARICYTDIGIDVLTAGVIPPNPAELLGSATMEQLLIALEKEYDYIIMDTPPVSVVTDAAVLGRFADGAILVIRQQHATIESAKLALKNLESAGVKVIGAVLNDFDAKTTHQGGGGGYYYSKDYEYKEN